MKKTTLLLAFLFTVFTCLLSNAQTAPVAPNTATATDSVRNMLEPMPPLQQLAPQVVTAASLNADALKFASDVLVAVEHLKPFTTNGTATVMFGYGQNIQSKESIIAAFVTVPVTDHAAVGFGGYRIGSEWADANMNLSYGVDTDLLFLGKVHNFVGDGLAWNFTKHEVANYAFTGQSKEWVTSWATIGIGYVVGNTSDRTGLDIVGGGHVTFKLSSLSGLNPLQYFSFGTAAVK